MEAIISFFEGIGRAIVAVFDFIVGFFSDIVYLIQLLAAVLLNLPTYFSWLPSSFLSTFLVVFTVVVIYKILGREG